MKIFYSRVSTTDQNDARQLTNLSGFDLVVNDKCSGIIPLWQRPKGKKIYTLLQQGKLKELHIHSIDRLGRDTISVLQIWRELTELGIRLVCRNPNFQNLNENGEIDIFSELMISILSTMSDFEKKLIKERQKEGIEKAKVEGRYTGRKSGTIESQEQFLNKPKSQAIIQAIRKGYSVSQITEKWSCSYATINKVSKAFQDIYGVNLMERKVNHLMV